MGLATEITITPVLRALMLVLSLVPLAAQAVPARLQTQEEIFRDARAAELVGDYDKLPRYDALLQGYLLEPYVESWMLRQRLEDASPDEVLAFLAREKGTVLAEEVRKDWLKVLGKQQRWDLFRAQLPLLVHEDKDIVCYALEARWVQNDESALEEVRPQWDAPRELPEGCVPLAEALIARGVLTDRQIWDRVRLLLRAGLVTAAWHTAGYLPRSERFDRGKLFEAAAGPKRYLRERNKDLSRRQVRELVMFAVYRLARRHPLVAEHYWRRQPRAKFPTEERGYVWGQLALHAALHHLPQALTWYGYAEADGARLSKFQLDWRMRAALREGNWRQVRVSARMMSPAQRKKPAWIYWQGRAAEALGKPAEAQRLFADIADGHYFYADLAGEELGLPFIIPPTDYTPTAADVAAIAREPGFQRSIALYRLGDRPDATREWLWSIRGMDDEQLLAAAEFALQNEIFDRAINTANKTRALHDFSVRYLAPFRAELGENARAQQLDEAWVLGLVRQESRFIPAIKSSAGAAGLMQLMPATARWVARRMGMRDYSWSRVTNTEVNAALGTYYLRHVLDELDDNPVLAAAAYNAGPRRADKWRGTHPLEGAIYAETIPIRETRNYVKKVMNNTMYYAAMLGGPVRSLKDRLGIVAPRGSDDGVIARGEP